MRIIHQLKLKYFHWNYEWSRMTAFFLCLAVLAVSMPVMPVQAAERKAPFSVASASVPMASDSEPEMLTDKASGSDAQFSDVVNFDSVELLYDSDAHEPVKDGDLLEEGEPLILLYRYHMVPEQIKKIEADKKYMLEVSPHLIPAEFEEDLKLSQEDGTPVKFGEILGDGRNVWVMFEENTDGTGTVLDEFGELSGAYFYLNCRRAAEPPEGEAPVEGTSHLFDVQLAEGRPVVRIGYAELAPAVTEAELSKAGEYRNRTITWTINYTPMQNPAADSGITTETPFRLTDVIDAAAHTYEPGSAKLNEKPIPEYATASDAGPEDEVYLVTGAPKEGEDQVLNFEGPLLCAGTATGKEPAQPLVITYGTVVRDELLLPSAENGGGRKVTNEVKLMAGQENGERLMKEAGGSAEVPQAVWVTKSGNTIRHENGSGATTRWTVTVNPNGFAFGAENQLTLHDLLPAKGSTLVEESVKVAVKAPGETRELIGWTLEECFDSDCSFTISPLITDGQDEIVITYDTRISEEMYEQGEDLGENTAWISFAYLTGNGWGTFVTPHVGVAVGSGLSGGTSTALLVKDDSTYNPATRTIDWRVTINPHKVYLKSGTFTDDLSIVGPQQCGNASHMHGLELVGAASPSDAVKIEIDGEAADSSDLVSVSYDVNRCVTAEVKEIGRSTVTLTYRTRVCDPCVFAGNFTEEAFVNTVTTENLVIGANGSEPRAASAGGTAPVSAEVLKKNMPVYNYETGKMEWTVEVNGAGLPMTGVVLEDLLMKELKYVEGSLKTEPEIQGASAQVEPENHSLIINLGDFTGRAVVTFETEADWEALGFASGTTEVRIVNEIAMTGSADGVIFDRVSSSTEQTFENHGLVKNEAANKEQEYIDYEVLINPFGVKLPANPSIVDTMSKGLQLDQDTLVLYKAEPTGTTEGGKPGYKKADGGRPLQISAFDLSKNAFTAVLPIEKGNMDTYLLTYRADIVEWGNGSFSNSVRFEGDGVLLGGGKNNSADLGGGGGGGGGGAAARKAAVSVTKKESVGGEPTEVLLPGVVFDLYQWDEDSGRGMPFARAVTDENGRLSFRVKPGAVYELVEAKGLSGYSSEFELEGASVPEGAHVEAGGDGLLITAGAAKSEIELVLTNEANEGEIAFSLSSSGGAPMTGMKIHIYEKDENGNRVPVGEVSVGPDGAVKISGLRDGRNYEAELPGGETMTIEVPAGGGRPVVGLDGTPVDLHKNPDIVGKLPSEWAWRLTVVKQDAEAGTPLAGAVFGLYLSGENGKEIARGVSDAEGRIDFAELVKGQSYVLREIEAPEGYALGSADYVLGEDDMSAGPVRITNEKKEDGGSGEGEDEGDGDSGDGDGGGSGNSNSSGNSGSSHRPGSSGSDVGHGPGVEGTAGSPEIPGGSPAAPAGPGSNRPETISGLPKTGDKPFGLPVLMLLSGAAMAAAALYQGLAKERRKEK